YRAEATMAQFSLGARVSGPKRALAVSWDLRRVTLLTRSVERKPRLFCVFDQGHYAAISLRRLQTPTGLGDLFSEGLNGMARSMIIGLQSGDLIRHSHQRLAQGGILPLRRVDLLLLLLNRLDDGRKQLAV